MTRRNLGLSLVEVVLALGVLGMAGVSIYQVFSGGYRIVYRSQYASAAAQVARETLEELEQATARAGGGVIFRQALHDPTGATVMPDGGEAAQTAANLLASWRAGATVTGPVFELSAALLPPAEGDAAGAAALEEVLRDPWLQYPPRYQRLHRKIELTRMTRADGSLETDILKARVVVTWEEEGIEQDAPTQAIFETFLVREDQSRLQAGGGG